MSPDAMRGVDPRAGGVLLAVVGPSGSGKDSLIAYARERVDPSVLFVRRIVTRAAASGSEDHHTLSREAFEQAEAAGAFAVTWHAHGLRYGIPRSAGDHVKGGGVAIMNGSRAALPSIEAAFGRVVTVSVTCRPEVLAERLTARGRESEAEIRRRLERAPIAVGPRDSCLEIDNSGELKSAGDALVAELRSWVRRLSATSDTGVARSLYFPDVADT